MTDDLRILVITQYDYKKIKDNIKEYDGIVSNLYDMGDVEYYTKSYIPRIGDEIVFKTDHTHKIENIKWDLRNNSVVIIISDFHV